MFKFPAEGSRCDEWVRALNIRTTRRFNWTPTKHSYVCVKHFYPEDLVWVDEYKDKFGNLRHYPRPKPVLRQDAVPRPDLLPRPFGESTAPKEVRRTEEKVCLPNAYAL